MTRLSTLSLDICNLPVKGVGLNLWSWFPNSSGFVSFPYDIFFLSELQSVFRSDFFFFFFYLQHYKIGRLKYKKLIAFSLGGWVFSVSLCIFESKMWLVAGKGRLRAAQGHYYSSWISLPFSQRNSGWWMRSAILWFVWVKLRVAGVI